MKNAPMNEPNEPMPELDDDLEPSPPRLPQHGDEPTIVAGVGSSALGSVDLEDESAEPQRERHPDNDGETVEG